MTSLRRLAPSTLAGHLASIAAAITIPFVVLIGLGLFQYNMNDRAHLLREGEAQSDRLMDSVNRFVERRQDLLATLSGSPALDGFIDPVRLRKQVETMPLSMPLLVVDTTTGQIKFSSHYEAQEALSRVKRRDIARHAMKLRQASVSDLIVDTGAGASVAIVQPVFRSGRVRDVLMVLVPVAALAETMIDTGIEAPFFGSLADRTGRIIARTDPRNQKTGQLLPGFDAVTEPKGAWSGVNPHGIAVYGFWNQDRHLGWTVTLGVSKEALEAPLWNSVLLMGTLALVTLCVVVVLVLLVGGRLAATFRLLAAAARSLTNRRSVDLPTLPVREAEAIGQAMVEAAEAMAAQEAELRAANTRLEERVEERTLALTAALTMAEAAEARARAANDELVRIAATDPLTGLSNRRAFDDMFRREIDVLRTQTSVLSLLIVDADHFKAINDTHGHHVGDEVLKRMARTLDDNLHRPADKAFRLGGEEFAVLLPATGQREAGLVAERLLAAIRAMALPPGWTGSRGVSVSIGIAATTGALPGEDAVQRLYAEADAALYRAKSSGRDRACLALDNRERAARTGEHPAGEPAGNVVRLSG